MTCALFVKSSSPSPDGEPVRNRDKSVIEDHFDYNLQLEAVLERAGKLDKLEEVRHVAEMVNIMSVRQKKQLGLGHAVLCARGLVGNEPFAVMVGDDLMFSGKPGIGQLMDVAMSENMPVIGVMEVPWEKVNRYGIRRHGSAVGKGEPLRHHCRG